MRNTLLAVMMCAMQIIIGQWLQSLKHYVYMCLLLSSPASLPHSPHPILLSLVAYFTVGLLLVDEQRNYGIVCAQIMLELSMLGAIAYFGLRWRRKLARLVQTYSALVGINLVITLVSLPVARALESSHDGNNRALFYATLLIMVWNLAVLSLILKRALEISTHLSAMISFNYFVLFYIVIVWLFQ